MSALRAESKPDPNAKSQPWEPRGSRPGSHFQGRHDPNGSETHGHVGGVITGYVFDCENRLKKVSYSDGAVSTYSYGGDGLRRTRQDPGQPVSTVIWDGSDYLGEVN